MSQRVEFGVPFASLQAAADTADRFFYSYKYAPISNLGSNGRPVLSKAQWIYLAQSVGLDVSSDQAWLDWHNASGTAEPVKHMLARRVPGSGFGSRGTHEQPGGGQGPGTHNPLGQTTEDVLMGLTRSQIGMLFLDRTRLSPVGLVPGEHVYALSLAPGEEVAIEQRSFLQAERSDEVQVESESTSENEKTESVTSDLSDVVSATLNKTSNQGFTAGGSVGFDYGVKVEAEAKDSNTTTEADTDTRTTTLKEVTARTAKNAAKIRDLHKTVVKVSSVDRFEQSSRRVIRNPNTLTPIDLHWFKLYQRLRFSHERYGVRLCWTPFVRDPAGDFMEAERAMHDRMVQAARDSIPAVSEPPPPQIQSVPGTQVVGLNPPMTELTEWGGWPGTDMSADYTLPISLPSGMKWDGDKDFLQGSLVATLTGAPRGFGVRTVGDPWEVVDGNGNRTVFQIVHAGAGWRLIGHSQIWVSLSARCIPDGASLTAAQNQAMEAWQSTVNRLRTERGARVAVAVQQAETAFAVWQAEHRRTLNVSQELLRRFINTMFPADVRDEIAELDMWNIVFDWELAAARLYSGTWSGDGLLRFPELSAHDFLNASWARLYLPVRSGFEGIALQWILTRSVRGTMPASIQHFTEKVVREMEQWRISHLGGSDELVVTPASGQACPNVTHRHVCLGTWTEDLPSDGLHIEVTQSPTSGADLDTQNRVEAETARIEAMAAALQSQSGLTDGLAAHPPQALDLHLRLDPGSP